MQVLRAEPEPVLEDDVVDAEVVEDTPEPPQAAPEPPKRPTAPTAAPKAADDDTTLPALRGTARAAVDIAKGQGIYSEVAEALKAAEIPLSSQKWDVAQCQQVLAIVADIVPADTETEEV